MPKQLFASEKLLTANGRQVNRISSDRLMQLQFTSQYQTRSQFSECPCRCQLPITQTDIQSLRSLYVFREFFFILNGIISVYPLHKTGEALVLCSIILIPSNKAAMLVVVHLPRKGIRAALFPTNQTFEKFLRAAFMAFTAAKKNACSASSLCSFSDVKLRSTICGCVAAKQTKYAFYH